jgi:hypothetical protein
VCVYICVCVRVQGPARDALQGVLAKQEAELKRLAAKPSQPQQQPQKQVSLWMLDWQATPAGCSRSVTYPHLHTSMLLSRPLRPPLIYIRHAMLTHTLSASVIAGGGPGQQPGLDCAECFARRTGGRRRQGLHLHHLLRMGPGGCVCVWLVPCTVCECRRRWG